MSSVREKSSSEKFDDAKAKPVTRFEKLNPCHKEHALSLRCLDEFHYDRDKCKDFFRNYNNCKAFWSFVVLERKRKGIQPHVPPPEEREQAKEEYLPFYQP